MYNFVNETVFSNVFDMSKKIHVISFQVPYPPNYGGAIDVYYKLQSLKEEGYYIILHTYQYRHDRYENELLSIVNEVHYYIRKTNILSQFSLTPYIVNSRKDKTLLRNLQKDDAPILFEGLHTCYFLNDSSLRNRIKLVRTHNVEHEYYKQLQLSSQSFRRKLFFYIEAFRLKRFEKVLTYANHILAISTNEQKYFEKKYPHVPTSLLPCFFEQQIQKDLPGNKNYILYQGNLSVEENIKAANYILTEIAPHLPDTNIIIAGANPSPIITKQAQDLNQVQIIGNPTDETLKELILNAKINLLITFQNTGVKLKLLNALYKGAYCIVNSPMVSGTGLEQLCKIADTPSGIIRLIEETMPQPYTSTDKLRREEALQVLYSNTKNIKIISRILD